MPWEVQVNGQTAENGQVSFSSVMGTGVPLALSPPRCSHSLTCLTAGHYGFALLKTVFSQSLLSLFLSLNSTSASTLPPTSALAYSKIHCKLYPRALLYNWSLKNIVDRERLVKWYTLCLFNVLVFILVWLEHPVCPFPYQ